MNWQHPPLSTTFGDIKNSVDKQGISSAEALQKASLELIKNKSSNMHEPYYWTDFTLNGDFR
jgi:CHAT domain-containing protein